MKKFIILVVALVSFAACTKSQAPQAPRQMAPQEVMGMMANDFAVVVDVREPDERAEVIDKARSMPMSKIEADSPEWKSFVDTLPKDKTIVFHCAAGGRAQSAAEKLSAQGFKTAYFDGPDQWKGAGLPLKKGQ